MANYLKNKLRRFHKGTIKKVETKHILIKKGIYGLKANESGRISANHLELIRRYLKRKLRYIRKRKKRKIQSKSWISIQCKYPITKKPSEIRMGKGKGAIDNYVYRIKSGKIIFESLGLSEVIYKKIFKKIMKKLPTRTQIVKKYLNY